MIARLACFALLAFAVPAPVQAAPTAETPGAATAAAPERKGDWSEVDFNASRARDEQRQKTWDRKMKALTGSVCTGC